MKSSIPRVDPDDTNLKADIFTLGPCIHFIMEIYLPFPELDHWKDQVEIVRRFETGHFSVLGELFNGDVIRKC